MSVSTYTTEVNPDWIDYNGHMSEAYYVLVFGFATDAAMDALGMGEQYRSESGCSLYTVEAHVRYLQEVSLGSTLHVVSEVVGATEKKLHLSHTMTVGETVVATEEILGLHVDQNQGGTVVFPDEVHRAVVGSLGEPAAWNGRRVCV